MKFKGTFIAPRIDLQKYKNAVRDELMEKLSLAAFEWLNATADQIPQWSGASAATFLHLARAVGYTLPISQSGIAPNRIPLGLGHGDGGFKIEQDRGRYFFHYGTTLPHLVYNEHNNANVDPDPTLFGRLLQPGPYRFQDKGRLAFLNVAGNTRLPNPFDSLKLNRIKVG